MPSKFAIFTNNIFKYLIFFCLSFIWINYYYHNFLLSVVFSIILSSAICFILTKLTYRSSEKTKLKTKQLKNANYCLCQLKFYSLTESLELISTCLKILNYNVEQKKEYIIANNTLVFPCFSNELTETIFKSIYLVFKQSGLKKLVILCCDVNNNFYDFFNLYDLLNVEIIKGEQVYLKIIEPSEVKVIEKVKLAETKKLKLNQIKNIMFNKAKAKSYFLCSLFLIFSSLFYPFGLYYQIGGTILLIFSLFSFYNKKYNKPSGNSFII